MVDVVIDHSRELIGKFLWVIALAFLNTKLLHYLMRTNVVETLNVSELVPICRGLTSLAGTLLRLSRAL